MKTSKLLALALATLLALSSFAFVGCGKPDYSTSSEGLEFKLNDDETGYVLTGLGTCTEEEIVVTNYNDLPVYEIAYRAFADCTTLESIVLGKYLEYVDSWAFEGCTNLKKVTFLGTIDDWVQIYFYNDYSNPLELAESLYIDGKLVTEARITTADHIDGYNLSNYGKLKNVYIGSSVEYIVGDAFIGCENLESIQVDEANTDFKSVDGCLYGVYPSIYDTVIYKLARYPSAKKGTTFTMPDFATGIEFMAFEGATNLKEVSIGANINYIASAPFLNCTNLEKINVDSNNANFYSVDGVLYSKEYYMDCLISYPAGKKDTTFVIDQNTFMLAQFAFTNAKNITKLVFLTTELISGGYHTFEGCTNLTEVFFIGNKSQWSSIRMTIAHDGTFPDVTVYYYSENQPTDSGNYWHYVNDVPTKW
ncbi:MAG: leucine-rich repeat protein [Clostridia bacterium]|nr:leucine-rich repeat protein [Clostridia bacterium]